MIYGTVCSGIGAPECAWEGLPWECAWQAEIEPFASAVLWHRFPCVPNHGDFTTIGADHGAIDLLCGGTPCQSFSVAGKRLGLDDPRGHLTLEFIRLTSRLRPRWIVWENVPGVLSDDGGRTFGTFLGLLGQLGYGFAHRVLDAQYFGVPQRRRRVFVVAYLGDHRPAAAVLFERESLLGDTAPRRAKGKGITGALAARATAGGGLGTDFDIDGGVVVGQCKGGDVGKIGVLRRGNRNVTGGVPFIASTTGAGTWTEGAGVLRARAQESHEHLVTHTLRGEGFDASEDGTGRGIPLVAATLRRGYADNYGRTAGNNGGVAEGHLVAFDAVQITSRATGTLSANGKAAGSATQQDAENGLLIAGTVSAKWAKGSGGPSGGPSGDERQNLVAFQSSQTDVRRLTPRECERLQGFPDDWTLIPWRGRAAELCPDGPRYRAIGNSMAVPVMRWIGERIQAMEEILRGSNNG